jgi:hypothetical protein
MAKFATGADQQLAIQDGISIPFDRSLVMAMTNMTPDMTAHDNFSLTMTATGALAAPTAPVAGRSGAITIDNGAGAFDLTFDPAWKFPGGTAPTLTKTAHAIDVLVYYINSPTSITARLIKDVK